MKKRLLALAITGVVSITYANEFNVIIKSDQVSYEVGGFTDKTEYTEWVVDSVHSCVPQLDPEIAYYNHDFLQTDDCIQTEKRTVTKIRVYNNGTEEVISTTEETQNTAVEQEYLAKGTHTENSCKDVLAGGFSAGSGVYHLTGTGTPFEVYCDMDYDGGGWTLVNSGTINQNTTDQEMRAYGEVYDETNGHLYEDVFKFVDMETPFLTDYDNRNTIQFTESRNIHEGETGTYRNHIKMTSSTNTGVSGEELSTVGISSYQVVYTGSGHSNPYNLQNCHYTTAYRGHVRCDLPNGGTTESGLTYADESQNPWYQVHKISDYDVSGIYGVHTCMRFIRSNGTTYSSCSERTISDDLFSTGCQGTLDWQNRVTDPSCGYRQNTASFYNWKTWVR